MLFRVNITPDDIRRVSVESLPETVDELVNILRQELGLQGDFILQFEDPEFQNELCNLSNMSDLPQGRATLKVIQKGAVVTASGNQISDSSIDTDLPHTPASHTQKWPDPFPVPTLSSSTELQLKQGNDAYSKNGSLLNITREMKSDILDKLAEAIYAIKAYPNNNEYNAVAKALVEKHPCLKEPGPTACGWSGWNFSLKFKMGNFRQKLRISGCAELSVNCRETSDSGDKTRVTKKARKSEVNFLPNLPTGKSFDSLEVDRCALENEMKKKKVAWKQVDALMDNTFSLRRKEVISEVPLVKDVKKRWPALFTQRQVAAEFRRIMAKDLGKAFFDGLDEYVPTFLQLYRERCSGDGALKCLVESLDADNSNQRRREVVLLGLPHYVREQPSKFLKNCEPLDEDDVVKGMDVGLLIVSEENPGDLLPKEIIDVAIVLEEQIVIDDLKDVSQGFAHLMGLLYVLNISYPKELKYTFEVVQKVIMKIGGDTCSSRVHAVRKKLLLKNQ
ncbi:uncharacterized protein LOC130567073 [Triplophysa rosa]|nr:uncharacterized protein LOC130567073 [Triplophysa rosa]